MYHIEDILIPVRYLILMLQIIITTTFSILGTYKDHIRARFPAYYVEYSPSDLSSQYDKERNIFFILLSIFYLCEAFELVLLFIGITLFRNKLSFALIFFHSICILYLNWFKHDVMQSRLIYIPLILGGIIPAFLEGSFLFCMCKYHRKVTEIR